MRVNSRDAEQPELLIRANQVHTVLRERARIEPSAHPHNRCTPAFTNEVTANSVERDTSTPDWSKGHATGWAPTTSRIQPRILEPGVGLLQNQRVGNMALVGVAGRDLSTPLYEEDRRRYTGDCHPNQR